MADKLEQVAIRMVEQPPLYSNEPMNNPDVAIRVMNEFLSQMDRELFCIVNLQADLTPINMNIVSVGSLNEALINPREIFKSAILSNASLQDGMGITIPFEIKENFQIAGFVFLLVLKILI